jgi:hypothetical protein
VREEEKEKKRARRLAHTSLCNTSLHNIVNNKPTRQNPAHAREEEATASPPFFFPRRPHHPLFGKKKHHKKNTMVSSSLAVGVRAGAAATSSSSSPAHHRRALVCARLRPSRRLLSPLLTRFTKEEDEARERQRQRELDVAREKRDKAAEEVRRALAEVKESAEAAKQSAPPPMSPREAALVKAVPFYVPAFTRYKEIAVGRVCMLAMAATGFFEVVRPDHPGPLRQVAQNFGWPLATVEMATAIFVLHGLLALWPSSPTYSDSNARDFLRR